MLKEQERFTQSIKRVHFLVHPGFCTLIASEHGYWKPYTKKHFESLFDRYVDTASHMTPAEALIVYTPTTREEFARHIKRHELYAQKIRQIKEALKERCIVLCGAYDIFQKKVVYIDLALDFITQRGFKLEPELDCVVYGETFGTCVPDEATILLESEKFANISIISGLTDVHPQSFYIPAEVKRMIPHGMKMYDQLPELK